MPRPDGVLYPSEVKAAKEAAKAAGIAAAENKKRLSDAASAELAKVVDQVAEAQGLRREGAKLKATPERVQLILKCIRSGLTVEKAIRYAGVSPDAVDNWKKRNATLSQLFERAEMDSEMELIGYIQQAAPKDHKAAAWLLERRHSWIAATRQEITGKDGGPMQSLTIHKHLLERISKAGDKPMVNVTPKKAEDSLSPA